jgi:DnaJ-class molecular chaperone
MSAYEVLGLPASANQRDVKRAYRRLAQKWHPDRNKAANAEATFKHIKAAYEFIAFGRGSGAQFEASPPPPPPPAPEPDWSYTYKPNQDTTFRESDWPRYEEPEAYTCRLTFDDLFTKSTYSINYDHAVKIPNSHHYHGHTETVTVGRKKYDVLYEFYDPEGFYQIKKYKGVLVLYCELRVTMAAMLAEIDLPIRNINPLVSDVKVPLTPSLEVIQVPHCGLKGKNGQRGILYVKPLIIPRKLEKELDFVRVALHIKLQEINSKQYDPKSFEWGNN